MVDGALRKRRPRGAEEVEVALSWERSVRQWNRVTFLVEEAERADG